MGIRGPAGRKYTDITAQGPAGGGTCILPLSLFTEVEVRTFTDTPKALMRFY